jgi:hypothetical protein
MALDSENRLGEAMGIVFTSHRTRLPGTSLGWIPLQSATTVMNAATTGTQTPTSERPDAALKRKLEPAARSE